MTKATVKSALLIAGGVLSVALGTLGVFVPLLPTTPFLLLAAWCFARSSDRLYAWLLNHRWFGSYIRNYREHGAIPLHTKIVTVALLWVTIGSSAVFVARTWWLRALLGVIAVGVTIHVLRLKTLKGAMPATQRSEDKCKKSEKTVYENGDENG